MSRLDGKVALITGGNSGIGKATAQLFAQEGASVVLIARRAELLSEVVQGIGMTGGCALGIPCDVTDPDQCAAAVQQTVDMFGKLDILVNNAGEGDYTRPITRIDHEFWHKIINVDQNSVFYMCQEALRYMEAAESGAIVNVSSVGGVFSNSGFAYAAAKHAVIGMTRNIAIQFAGRGIRCNAVCPGGTDTPLIQKMQSGSDAEFSRITAKHFRRDLPMCTPEDQANAILFLACDDSSAINGQALVVDNGGWI